MRQLDRQRLVLQYLHDNCLSESDVEIIFEPTGEISHKFKDSTSKVAVNSTEIVESQITDSVSTVNLTPLLSKNIEDFPLDDNLKEIEQESKLEMDAPKKKRPPPPKKKA